MTCPPILTPPEPSWTLPVFVIDGVWDSKDQPSWGDRWTLHDRGPGTLQEVTIEGSDERFELIEIRYPNSSDEPAQIFLHRLPKENP